MEVKFKKLHPDAVLPKHAKYGDAGLDLTIVQIDPSVYTRGTSKGIESISLFETHHYGVAVEIPEKHVGLMFPRSSIKDYNASLTNSVGVIDSGYRGELKAVFRRSGQYNNIGKDYVEGDRSAQLVIVPYVMAETMFVDELSDSERGESGYGSTNDAFGIIQPVKDVEKDLQKDLKKSSDVFLDSVRQKVTTDQEDIKRRFPPRKLEGHMYIEEAQRIAARYYGYTEWETLKQSFGPVQSAKMFKDCINDFNITIVDHLE